MSIDANQLIAENPDLTETFKDLLKNSDVTSIEDVIKNLNMMADVKRKEEYATLYHEFQDRVVALGFLTVQDFITAIEAQGIIKPSRTSRRKVKIRFRDTENENNTWTGRGKQPKWLQAHIENGRQLEEFEVKEPEESESETESEAKA
ncbi:MULTISPECIES: H-NS histone family protein [Acinetobacter]|uniref:H-NS histone family protein n=1 Tax=Acinetobacter TaxID=469 RepID=UPI00028CBD2E|nr:MULTISPECIES: H-NS histone family protein [Acinetobacter]EKU3442197.1 H-NS histone family protein [Acinetobacter baumannii]MDP7849727.1 H-NS histone family protein [Acinetobacter baumannii]BBL22386.1 hypothetical protein ACRAD_30570 [Acinetobacter radioresistens DSM 6976 = NBRC 102413 = CIP 103788]